MSKKTTTALVLAFLLGVALLGTVATVDWGAGDDINSIPFNPVEGDPEFGDSLNYALFEDYGAIVFVMGLLMFAAILGGVYLAKEDPE